MTRTAAYRNGELRDRREVWLVLLEQTGGNTTHTGPARLWAWADVGADAMIGPTGQLDQPLQAVEGGVRPDPPHPPAADLGS